MRWTKVIEEKRNWEVCYRGYDGQTTVWTIEKISCGGGPTSIA
jgi:hypothetical protein